MTTRTRAVATIAFLLYVAIVLGTLFMLAGPTEPVWLWVLTMIYFALVIAMVIRKQLSVLAKERRRGLSSDGGPPAVET